MYRNLGLGKILNLHSSLRIKNIFNPLFLLNPVMLSSEFMFVCLFCLLLQCKGERSNHIRQKW